MTVVYLTLHWTGVFLWVAAFLSALDRRYARACVLASLAAASFAALVVLARS